MSSQNCSHPPSCRHSAWLSFHSIEAAAYRNDALDRAERLLDENERRRALRLRQETHRARWVVAHAIQRVELAAFLGCHPERVRYQHSPEGRPSLLPAPTGHNYPDFNISHSDDLLLMGISVCGRIGVDVEAWAPASVPDREPLWETLSEDEAQWVAAQHDPYAAFVRLWTRKEAIVKAVGFGLPNELTAINALSAPHSSDAMLRLSDGTSLRVIDLAAPPGFHAAAAFTVLDLQVHVMADASAADRFSHCQ
jgi:4'-phosphopantetheinyl transferase